MSEVNTARPCDATPPVVTTIVTTADARVVVPGPDLDTATDHAIRNRPLDIRALFERSWARHEAGYRRLAER